jgi:hypothetical protein
MPEGEVPASDLEEMLDWNHILLKEVVSAAELEAYRKKYIRNRKPVKTRIEVITEHAPPPPVMAPKHICEFVKWTDRLAMENPDLWKVRIWGDPELPGLDVRLVGTSNFQAVGLYVKETRQRGAVKNFLSLGRDDLDKLSAMQLEDEYEDKQPDWRNQKMSWLFKEKGTIYFTDKTSKRRGRGGGDGEYPFLWGTVALGGNLVYVEDEEKIEFKLAGGKKEKLRMARLRAFKKPDWDKPLDELLSKGLVHRCFCAYKRPWPNKPGDTPKGIMYSPFYSPQDWDFSGTAKPSAFYLPFDQLVKPIDKDGNLYEGIVQKLECKDEE